MNFGDIIQQVLSNVEASQQDAETDVRNAINKSMDAVWRYATWKGLEKIYFADTEVGTKSINFTDIGSDFGKVLGVYYKPDGSTKYKRLTPERDFAEFSERDLTVTGTPHTWAEFGNKLYVYPGADQAGANKFKIFGKKIYPHMTDNANEPEFIPDPYREILINGGTWKYFDKDDDTRAQLFQGYFRNNLREMHAELVENPDDDDVAEVQFDSGHR